MSGPRILFAQGALLAEVSLEGDLPGSGLPRLGEIHLRERWARRYVDQPWRLNEYAYDLIVEADALVMDMQVPEGMLRFEQRHRVATAAPTRVPGGPCGFA